MLSEKARKIPTSAALAINAKCIALEKEGKDVVKFAIGESDFNAPDFLKEAAIKAIKEDFCHYTAASGMPELKEAIRKKFERENNLKYEQDEVIASSGGKGVLWAALQVLVNPGDEILTPLPYYLSYPPLIELVDAKMTTVLAPEENNFELKADLIGEKVNEKTKVFLFCNPSNPTGGYTNKAELKRIADILIENKVYCISDEVYDNLVYDEEFTSIASLNEEIKKLTVIANAASKTYAVSGWRIGYGAGPKEIIKAMGALQSHEIGNPNCIAQKAIITALNNPKDFVKEMKEEFGKRRELFVKRLNEIDGISCVKPKGAMYVFPNISGCFNNRINSAQKFCNELLEKELVGTIPGEACGSKNNMRITFAGSLERINDGLDRIERFVKSS